MGDPSLNGVRETKTRPVTLARKRVFFAKPGSETVTPGDALFVRGRSTVPPVTGSKVSVVSPLESTPVLGGVIERRGDDGSLQPIIANVSAQSAAKLH